MHVDDPLYQECARCIFDFRLHGGKVVHWHHFLDLLQLHVFVNLLSVLGKVLNISELKLVVQVHVFHLFFFEFGQTGFENFRDRLLDSVLATCAYVVTLLWVFDVELGNRLQVTIVFRVCLRLCLELLLGLLRTDWVNHLSGDHH